jgi:hypothetical protein
MRVTLLSPKLATHTAPAPTATPSGSVPTGIGRPTTRPVSGSMRVTVFATLLVTQTKPSPKAMSRDVVGQRIKERLDYSPIEEKDTATLAELATRLMWTAERAAEWNAIALAARKQEAARQLQPDPGGLILRLYR